MKILYLLLTFSSALLRDPHPREPAETFYTCNSECEWCCVDSTYCGTQAQCEDEYYAFLLINTLYASLCLTLAATLFFQCATCGRGVNIKD